MTESPKQNFEVVAQAAKQKLFAEQEREEAKKAQLRARLQIEQEKTNRRARKLCTGAVLRGLTPVMSWLHYWLLLGFTALIFVSLIFGEMLQATTLLMLFGTWVVIASVLWLWVLVIASRHRKEITALPFAVENLEIVLNSIGFGSNNSNRILFDFVGQAPSPEQLRDVLAAIDTEVEVKLEGSNQAQQWFWLKHKTFSSPGIALFGAHRRWLTLWFYAACETALLALHGQHPIKSIEFSLSDWDVW